jgi:hypothetical protein
MFTRTFNFNRRAEEWAERHGKPMVGNGDVHRLRQLGTTYSMVDAPNDVGAICEAIRRGRVRVEAAPLSITAAARVLLDLFSYDIRDAVGKLRRRVPRLAASARRA